MSDETNYSEYDNDLGLDEDDRKAAKSDSDIEWYKGVKGKTDRASFIYFHPVDVVARNKARKKNPKLAPADLAEVAKKALADRAQSLSKSIDQLTEIDKLDLSEVQFKRMVHHFGGEGIGDVLSLLGRGSPEDDMVWKRLEEPKTHFSTLLLLYPSTKGGELLKDHLASWAAAPTIVPWKFSYKRYEAIGKVHGGLSKNGLSISDQDIFLECKEDKYQQIEPSADGKATWLKIDQLKPDLRLKQNILARAIKLFPKLVPYRAMTTQQLREKLGLSEPSGGSSSVGGSEVSSAEFDAMINQV